MKVCGPMTWLMGRGVLFMRMEMFMKDRGSMTKQKVSENILTWMVLSTKVNGRKTNNMDMGLSHGLMEQYTMESTSMVKSMERDLSNGLMERLMKEISLIITSMDSVFISGQMEEYLKVNGSVIKCMAKELSSGEMAGSMKETILTTKKKATVCLSGKFHFLIVKGLMVESTKDSGTMENSMEREHTLLLLDREEKVSGRKGKELIG